MRRTHLAIVLINLTAAICGGLQVAGQDIHFTQFGQTPLLLNPAETGLMDADWRLSAGHRHQWKALGRPFITSYLGYDKQVFVKRQHFSIGGVLIHDASSPQNLEVSKALINASYHWHVKMHAVHLGVQGGMVNTGVNLRETTFPDQYDRGTGDFNTALPNNEPQLRESTFYSALNVGAFYSYRFRKAFVKAGIAMHHINRPKSALFTQTYQLPVRKVYSLKLDAHVLRHWDISPLAAYMFHNKASELMLGFYTYYRLFSPTSNQKVYGGVLYRTGAQRNSDATAIVMGVQLANVDVGLSYDLTVSELNQANDLRGGFEVTLTYRGASALLQKNSIPCERY